MPTPPDRNADCTERIDAATDSTIAAAVPKMRRVLTGKLRNRADAEDVVQLACENFVRRLRDRGQPPIQNVECFLFMTAWHAVTDERRRQQREAALFSRELAGEKAASGNPEDLLHSEQALRVVQREMKGADIGIRRALELRAEGFSYAEIARLSGMPKKLVKEALRAGRDQLEILRKLLDLPPRRRNAGARRAPRPSEL